MRGMDFYSLPDYKKLAEAIERSRRQKYNLEILTLPGSGATFYLKRYYEKEKAKDLKLITDALQELGLYNLVMADLALEPEAMVWIENYLRSASPDQKFCILVNDPSSEGTYLKQHSYEKYYFGVQDKESMKNMAKFLSLKPSEKEMQKVLQFSGGFGQLAKYLFTHDKIEEAELTKLMQTTKDVLKKLDSSVLKKLGLKGSFWDEVNVNAKFDISIGADLVVTENDLVGAQLTVVEANIIKQMLTNNGVIEKEKVSEIKWPGTSFDDFSEQAINKSMRRLSYKLKRHEIQAIPKYGYRLVAK